MAERRVLRNLALPHWQLFADYKNVRDNFAKGASLVQVFAVTLSSKLKRPAKEIGPKMTSDFARIASEREEVSKKGTHALWLKYFLKRGKSLLNSFGVLRRFALWTLTTFVEVYYYRLMISDVVQSKITGLLRSLKKNARDPENLEFRFQYAKKALNSCLSS